ncbi:hypothetical protein [Paraflavitalea speifideaquila]|uniref:hypothetical protein n=1 Tax=Paraflavitalea speifideaquila TaxID=3076558 RepID=UPI0028E18833|nr:hypothetical protein [Paraflavitalea speifideiaquila]
MEKRTMAGMLSNDENISSGDSTGSSIKWSTSGCWQAFFPAIGVLLTEAAKIQSCASVNSLKD